MGYRKLRADRLFTGLEWLDNQMVLVLDELGKVEGIVPLDEAGEDVEKLEGILSPGFINCHCHLELSHMQGLIPRETGMLGFINAVMDQRAADNTVIEQAMEAAEQSMLNKGIVATGDICNTAVSLTQKRKGNMYYHNFIELSGFNPGTVIQRFDQGLSVFNEFAQQYGLPVESNSLVPHAPYSVAKDLFKMIMNFPGNHLITIHNQESPAEEAFFKNKKGDFLQLYQKLGLDISFWEAPAKPGIIDLLPHLYKNQSLILVHNVFTSKKDIEFIQEIQKRNAQQIYFCLCPNANLYIGNGLPNIDIILQSGCPVVLGTDSLASNSQLCIWEEIKTLLEHFPQLTIEKVLPWATINGACALEMESILGSFEKGKQPGVVMVREVGVEVVSR